MAFSVISIAPGLSRDDYCRAVANGPEFIESDTDYPTLLDQTGWTDLERHDITGDYAASISRQLRADDEQEHALEALIGASEVAERQAGWRSKLMVLGEGLLYRELFVARAGPASAEGEKYRTQAARPPRDLRGMAERGCGSTAGRGSPNGGGGAAGR
jgi:hypothetical protein